MPGSTGHPLTFWDMPGLGESARADRAYLAMYREKLSVSDVAAVRAHQQDDVRPDQDRPDHSSAVDLPSR